MMAKLDDDNQATTDEKDNYIENSSNSNSNNSSDVELDYDKKHRVLKTKLNHRVLDISLIKSVIQKKKH